MFTLLKKSFRQVNLEVLVKETPHPFPLFTNGCFHFRVGPTAYDLGHLNDQIVKFLRIYPGPQSGPLDGVLDLRSYLIVGVPNPDHDGNYLAVATFGLVVNFLH